MPSGEVRDRFLEALDEPRHALEYGGVSGEATIQGIPTGTADRPGERSGRLTAKLGIVTEPVPVLMRDAVTIDTAVRLTGISRMTLQRAAQNGNLPVLKLGPDTAPYVVRLRDVITYLVTMWTERRARKELTDGDQYIGFPEWLVREVAESWPEHRAFKPGKWQAGPVKVNRGGRPRGYSPSDPHNPGFSVHGVRQGRPRKTDGGQKKEPPGAYQPQAAQDAPDPPEPTDRTKLPKWHPLWQRPQDRGSSPQPGRSGR